MASHKSSRIGKNFSAKTKQHLAERVAYMCSQPYCRILTIKPKSDQNISVKSGKASHIISAGTNGPRTDTTISDEVIKSFNNGIWLCDKCSREVDDNESPYTVTELTKWKKDAEEYVESLVTHDTRLRQLRILTQSNLSALRILSALPLQLDQTFEHPNGNGINLTRLFIELELVLYDNLFLKEADIIKAIMSDLENLVCPFILKNVSSGIQSNISDWKNKAVKLIMINIMQFTEDAYQRYLSTEMLMVNNELSILNTRSITPTILPLTSSSVENLISISTIQLNP